MLKLPKRQNITQLSGGNVRNISLHCSHNHLDNIHHLLLTIWQLHLHLCLSSISWLCLHIPSPFSTFSSQSSKHFIPPDRNLHKGRDCGSQESCSRHHHQTSPIRRERHWYEQNSTLLHGIFQWTSHSPQVEHPHESWHWLSFLWAQVQHSVSVAREDPWPFPWCSLPQSPGPCRLTVDGRGRCQGHEHHCHGQCSS